MVSFEARSWEVSPPGCGSRLRVAWVCTWGLEFLGLVLEIGGGVKFAVGMPPSLQGLVVRRG